MLCFDAFKTDFKSSEIGIFKKRGTNPFPYSSSSFVLGDGLVAKVLITVTSEMSVFPCLREYSLMVYDTIV
jgi:hypothetical protein